LHANINNVQSYCLANTNNEQIQLVVIVNYLQSVANTNTQELE